MSTFYKSKPEEKPAGAKFKRACGYSGMRVHMSQRMLNALKGVMGGNVAVLSESALALLEHKGMVMIDKQGAHAVTEIGILTLALGEAAGLI